MTVSDLITKMNGSVEVPANTCDQVFFADDQRELHKVAVGMFPTVRLLREVREWGADLLIVHEPLLFERTDDPVNAEKEKVMRDLGCPIYRFHDHPHLTEPDLIAEGGIHALQLKGTIHKTSYFGTYLFDSENAVTALEMAKRAEESMGIAHVRICGEREYPCRKIALCLGWPAGVYDLLCREDVEMVLVGETTECTVCEYARDAAELGFHKSLLVMGHAGSEWNGMKLLTERLSGSYPEFETKYFDCAEVYTYSVSIGNI